MIDTNGLEGDANLLQNMSMCRTNSVRSRLGGSISKSLEVTQIQTKYEAEINELREHKVKLETKNKKYLEIIGMTAGEQQENLKLQMEAAQEAITFSKRAKMQGNSENEIQIFEEIEEMLDIQQKEVQVYQDQVSALTADLETQRNTNDEKSQIQQRVFDALNKAESEKAQF